MRATLSADGWFLFTKGKTNHNHPKIPQQSLNDSVPADGWLENGIQNEMPLRRNSIDNIIRTLQT